MMGLVIGVHVIACIFLIIIILVQAGRGGGLVENFSGVESMFGTKTNAFLTRSTSVLSVIFFITCLSLAFMSSRQSKSLMGQRANQQQSAVQETQEKTPLQLDSQNKAAPEQLKPQATAEVIPEQKAAEKAASEEIPAQEVAK